MIDYQERLHRAASLLTQARHAIVFTGAGISTHSGIPDFRSHTSGLWQQDDPMEVATLSVFRYHPQRFFEWLRPLADRIWNAKPNIAHMTLTKMEHAGILHAIITQNIDGLHQRAGSSSVIELHGSMETLSCLKCQINYPNTYFAVAFIENGVIPLCPVCRTILKPDIVLFEELLPEDAWNQAAQYCKIADVVLVIGSSLQVTPAALLPEMARNHGGRLILVNFSPTHLDRAADVVFHEDLLEIIPALWRIIET